MAGQCWGGGGTINWGVSLRTPSAVRNEWACRVLAFFKSDGFQSSLDRVCSVRVVSDAAIQGNLGNQVLLDGARKLGWQAMTCPQNSGGSTHHCGSSCGLGCRTGQG